MVGGLGCQRGGLENIWGNLRSKQTWNYILLSPLPPFFLHTCSTCLTFFWCLHIQKDFVLYIRCRVQHWSILVVPMHSFVFQIFCCRLSVDLPFLFGTVLQRLWCQMPQPHRAITFLASWIITFGILLNVLLNLDGLYHTQATSLQLVGQGFEGLRFRV